MASATTGISFVVVARNEERRLPLCLDSISRLQLLDCEVICVNSESTDGTLEVMHAYQTRFSQFRLLSPIRCRNAAAARNAGKSAASRDAIFFVDGDVQLSRGFVEAAIRELEDPEVSAVTGGLDEILYDDESGQVLRGSYVRHSFGEKTKVMSCGGILLVRRSIAELIGDYDERFYVNEDIDYALRITEKHTLIALPLSMGTHHTSEYRDRSWLHVRNGYVVNQGMLARKHMRRPGFWQYWYKSRKSYVWGGAAIVLLLLALSVFLCGELPLAGLLLLLLTVMISQSLIALFRRKGIWSSFVLTWLCPPLVLWGFAVEPWVD